MNAGFQCFQITLVQRALAAEKGKTTGPAHRARSVRHPRGDQQRLCEEDENLAARHPGGRHAKKGGQVREHRHQAGLEVGHEGDVPEGGRPDARQDSRRHCVPDSRQAASAVQARGQ